MNSKKDTRPSEQEKIIVKPTVPKERQSLLKWEGWGYKDTYFEWPPETTECVLKGGRYIGPGDVKLPFLLNYFIDKLGLDVASAEKQFNERSNSLENPANHFPESILIGSTLTSVTSHLDKESIGWSTDGKDRLFRSHGHTLEEIYNFRNGVWGRLPDIVVWPNSSKDVESVLSLAKEFNLVVIPYGGGTNVSGALICNKAELRPIVSLDTSQMCNILNLDEENMTCIAEAGITGKGIENVLNSRGYTLGHEPDSYELSTMGGWVATRASGMKKNKYGNIEDIVLGVKMVSPLGVVESFTGACPRVSGGPNVIGLILGSEGCLGVITEVHVKIRSLPKCKRYGSIVFPNFDCGVSCLREIARKRCQPASIRLMDNEQYKFGYAFRPEPTYMDSWKEWIKMAYLTKWKTLDLNEISVATLLFEGDEDEVTKEEAKVYSIAAKFGGFAGGGTNGERGYNLTFAIAYIRDVGIDLGILGDSHETSVPWSATKALCSNTKHRVESECRNQGINVFVSCRVTQTYDSGSCVYFYFAIKSDGLKDPAGSFLKLEDIVRNEMIRSGGSISHHHGVGKIRSKFIPKTQSLASLQAIQGVKNALDPSNILAAGNNVFGLDLKLTEDNGID